MREHEGENLRERRDLSVSEDSPLSVVLPLGFAPRAQRKYTSDLR